MQEITVTLRFNRVCLGAAKKRRNGQVIFCFERDPGDRVMFMSSAWLSCMRYAAKLSNRHHAEVKKIDWCPVIVGEPRKDWRRTILTPNENGMRSHYALHEAFRPGDTVVISAVLPDEIPLDDFNHLLTLVGKYRGFSPFNNAQEKYGTFEVISLEPVAGPGGD
ncbi:MAG: hypothetical protein EBZ69_00175 [Alphaproteobacteria bacterium]|nr:hypothetical protein [Alphaproteobacteria bacterium]